MTKDVFSKKFLSVEGIIFLALMLILLITPYFRGLFFRENNYVVQLLCTILIIILIVSKMKKKENFFPDRRVDLLMWGLPFAYFISYFVAADPGLAKDELLKNINFVIVYYMLAITMKEKMHRKIVINVLITMALWTALFGYGAALGDWKFEDAVLSDRISSVFQYPNTLASILGATILMCLILSLKIYQKEGNEKEICLKKGAIISSVYLVIGNLLFAIFILTYSRGAWLVFALSYILTTALLPLKEKVPFIFNTIISLSLAIYPIIKHKEAVAQASWKYLLISMFLTMLIALCYNYFYHSFKLQHKKLLRFQIAIALAMVVIVSVSVPIASKAISSNQNMMQTVIQRVETFHAVNKDNSASARLDFYQDAMKMYIDHPVIGMGGGAWKAMFVKYQSYSYWSNQAHIYYLQVATETGTIGIIILLLIIITFLMTSGMLYIKLKKENEWHLIFAVLIAFIMLMGHNFLDFDMSFSTYGLLIISLIAVSFTEYRECLLINEKSIINGHEFNKKFFAKLNKPIIKSKFPVYMLLSLSIGLILANAQPIKAYSHYEKAHATEMTKQKGIALLEFEKAYKIEPSNTEMMLVYINYLQLILPYINNEKLQEQQRMQAISILEKAQDQVPYNAKIKQNLSSLYAQSGQADKVMQETEEAIEVAPYNADCYKQRITLEYIILEKILYNKNYINHVEKINKQIIDCFNEANIKERELNIKGKNQNSNKPFTVDAETKLYAGKTYYLAGNYTKAKDLLTIAYADAEMQQDANLWLAATYKKLNDAQNYQVCANRSKMTSKDFTAQINKIIAMSKV